MGIQRVCIWCCPGIITFLCYTDHHNVFELELIWQGYSLLLGVMKYVDGNLQWLSWCYHYSDVIMTAITSQITSLTVVYSTVYSDADQRKHQSSASLAFVWGIHRGPVNSPHKWPVSRKMFPFDDVIMIPRIYKCVTPDQTYPNDAWNRFWFGHLRYTNNSISYCSLF